MDWNNPLPTSLFYFQSGLEKSGLAPGEREGRNELKWRSNYASVVTMVGETGSFASSDGMNSQGLVANVLYDNQAKYKAKDGKEHQHLSVLRWVQYVVDQFATVRDVVLAFQSNEIELVGAQVPGSTEAREATLHLSVSDNAGESAIFEVYNGVFHIHYSGDLGQQADADAKLFQNVACNVMTNEPSYSVQLRLNDYWLWQWSDDNTFASRTIPGGPFPTDRFERANYYYNHLDSANDMNDSLAQSKSVVMNASVPIGMQGFDGHPNIAPTIWTTISDQTNRVYYFANARTANVVNTDLQIAFSDPVMQLDLVTMKKDGTYKNKNYNGNVNKKFEKSQDPYAV